MSLYRVPPPLGHNRRRRPFITCGQYGANTGAYRISVVNHVLDRGDGKDHAFNLVHHAAELDRLVAKMPDCKMIGIHPITCYLPGKDQSSTGDMRDAFRPLQKLARDRNVAIVMVSHLNKGGSGSKAVYRTTGNMAFVAVARTSWIVAKDGEESERRLFLPAKNNLAPDDQGYAFKLVQGTNGASRILFEAGRVNTSADEALSNRRPSKNSLWPTFATIARFGGLF
jgi:hypothetical protein